MQRTVQYPSVSVGVSGFYDQMGEEEGRQWPLLQREEASFLLPQLAGLSILQHIMMVFLTLEAL